MLKTWCAGQDLNPQPDRYEQRRHAQAIPAVRELNIGHFIVGEAVFIGLAEAIRRMRAIMDAARRR
ncbi:MAG: pyridoxine 5'-phosphate synthase [Acidiphilium sp.]|nr:pyridoxine 5'-phosphate synthase [Acidiphilium sp.]MDD4936738.1 pyridoxine 5'-phosphate synthase [Acidiphilium sp.]